MKSSERTVNDDQSRLIERLIPLLEHRFDAKVTQIETHISTVLLVARQAFKIKKPVDFGFLDFSTLPLRRHFCEEELRLNRRFAPQLYQRVVSICGTVEAPQLDGEGEVIEYMVQMARFDQQQTLDQRIADADFRADQIDQLADSVAHFHQLIAVADGSAPFVQPEVVRQAMEQNFEQIGPLQTVLPESIQQQLDTLAQWSRQHYSQLLPLLQLRLKQGFVRECHGDLHLGNIALIDDEPTLFDGIEFNDAFRWIDVISDLSFLWMDLLNHRQECYAYRLLNRYLEVSGDYAGVELLTFYAIYRAMVRTKVDLFRLAQMEAETDEYRQLIDEVVALVELASRLMQQRCRFLMITHGVSGSGKSYASQQVVESFRAIRIRSDVERLRRFPDPQQRYHAEATAQTYQTLHQLAAQLCVCGHTVVLDATYLKRAQRQQAAAAAEESGCRWLILDLHCNEEELVRRIEARLQQHDDPSEADEMVLRQQLQHRQRLSDEEQQAAVVVHPGDDIVAIMQPVVSSTLSP